MLVDGLFAKLLAKNISQIRLVYFSEDSGRLTSSQVTQYPQVRECNWTREWCGLQGEHETAYVFSMPSSGWPHEFNLEDVLTAQSHSVYLLVPANYIDNPGQLLFSVVTPNVVISSVSVFGSLSQDYVLEVRHVRSLGSRYISQIISELPFEKLQNSHRNTLLLSQRSELDRISSKNAALSDELDKASSKNTALRDEISRLRSHSGQAKTEIVYHKERHRQLKSSFSYRFGNILARSSKSPRGIILLPFRIVDFFFTGVNKKLGIYISRYRAEQGDTSKNPFTALREILTGKAKSAPAKKVIDKNSLQLANYLSNDELEDKWTAVISSNWLFERIKEYPSVHNIHPNTWPAMFEERLPARLVVDSLDMLKNSPWLLNLEGNAYGYPGKLVELLEYCSSHGVETVLWHSAPPETNRIVAEISSLFSKVLIADLDEMKYLKDTYGIAEEILCYFTLGVDKKRMTPHEERCNDQLPRVVIPETVADPEVEALRAAYRTFPASAGHDGIVTGTLKEATFGDFVMIPWYPKTKGYLPVEFFLAIEKGCIPFTTSMSTVNVDFAELVPVIASPDSLREAFRPLQEETITLSDWVMALRKRALDNFDLSRRLQVLFEMDKALIPTSITQDAA